MGNNLIDLGTGNGTKVEGVKASSNFLRGTLAESLTSAEPALSEADANLLKFHGSYQQEDRDQRRARREDGSEKAYQFMIRTRVPGGILTPSQYLAEDSLAEKYGNGTLRVTTRQGFQHHGVLKGNLKALIAEINAAHLTTLAACGDVNRNVMACPAPVRTAAQQEIQATADAIARRLTPQTTAYREIWIDGERIPEDNPTSEPLYGPTYLPRKFKIGIARPDDNCVDVFTQDIGLVAAIDGDTLRGFTVLVGGGMGMTHGKKETFPRLGTPLCYVDREDVIRVVEAIVTTYRDWGDRTNRKHARLKYVVEERGIDWMRAEVEQRSGVAYRKPHGLDLRNVDDHLGWHARDEALAYLGVFIENGRIRDTETVRLRSALREAVERFRLGVRLTGQQNLLLTDISQYDVPEVGSIFARHGVELNPVKLGTRRDAMACPALPTCGLALTDAERVLPAIVGEINDEMTRLGIGSRRLSIRMTGCPNGCARPYMGDIGFVGRSKDLYDVFLGGDWGNTRMNWVFSTSIKRDLLVATIAPLLRRWRDEGNATETFGDFCDRLGRATLLEHEAAS
jgi:sulfite reductase (ferredoxin)